MHHSGAYEIAALICERGGLGVFIYAFGDGELSRQLSGTGELYELTSP